MNTFKGYFTRIIVKFSFLVLGLAACHIHWAPKMLFDGKSSLFFVKQGMV